MLPGGSGDGPSAVTLLAGAVSFGDSASQARQPSPHHTPAVKKASTRPQPAELPSTSCWAAAGLAMGSMRARIP
jgi:hypothetical protein